VAPGPIAGRSRDAGTSPMGWVARGTTVRRRDRGNPRVDSATDIRHLLRVASVTPEIARGRVPDLVLPTMAKKTGGPRKRDFPVRFDSPAGRSPPVGIPRRRRHAVAFPDAAGRVGPRWVGCELRVRVAIGTVQGGVRDTRMLPDLEVTDLLPAPYDQPEPVAEKASFLVIGQGQTGRKDQDGKNPTRQRNRREGPIPHKNARPR